MAVKFEDAADAPKQTTTQAATSTYEVNPISSIFDRLMKTSAMDETAKKHFETLMESLKRDPYIKHDEYPMSSYEARFIFSTDTKQGIILIYDASYEANAPLSTKSQEIFNTIKAKRPDIRVITSLVIIPADYSRVQILARHVGAMVSQARSTLTAPAKQWGQYGSFVVTNRMGQIFDIISKNWPHAVAPRCDYGCAIFLAPANKQCKKPDGSWDYDLMEPIAAVTAYTNFIPAPDGSGMKFQPLVRITSVIPAIPHPSMLALALPIAIDRFISCKDWVNAIRSYGPRCPNIGNLIPDPTGQLINLQNDQQRNEFIQKYTLGEYIGFDVVEGQLGVPGRERLVSTAMGPAQSKLKEYFANFLGIDAGVLAAPLTRGEFSSNIGFLEGVESDYVNKNSMADSRYVDYLTMAISIKDPQVLNQLFDMNPNPAMRKALIKGWFTSYRELFSCKTVVFEPSSANIIRNSLAQELQGKVHYDVEQAQVFFQNHMVNTMFNLGGNSASPFAGSYIGGVAGQEFNPNLTMFE